MPQHRAPLPLPPQPTKIFYDPFNSSATGHQRAEDRMSSSTFWRNSRTFKLSHQFRDQSGRGGDQHLPSLLGSGSKELGRYEDKENAGREKGCQDIRKMMGGTRKRRSEVAHEVVAAKKSRQDDKNLPPKEDSKDPNSEEPPSGASPTREESQPRQIFRSLNLYINGSTAPLVSDHRLKQLWVQHGGSVSVGLARRTVTHVVLGDRGKGGGGLASGKIQKEVSRVRGKGVKYVDVQWVLDCIEKGRKLSEASYGVVRRRVGGAGQESVQAMFGRPRGGAKD